MSQKSKNIEAIYNLSPMQEGMLFHALLEEQSGSYFEQLGCLLEGDLEPKALERAWQSVVARHDILRTLFTWKNRKSPLQVVLRKTDLPLRQHDLRDLSPQQQQERLHALRDEDRSQGFVLNKAPLMRISLARLGPRSWYFLWSHHHIILDGWSVARVMGEIFVIYEHHRAGRMSQLEQPRPFRNYINWMKQQNPAKAEPWFRNYLAGFRAPTLLPRRGSVFPEPVEAQRGLENRTLDVAFCQALIAYAKARRVTVNCVIQASWALLLAAHSGDWDVCFGATLSGRPADLEGVDSMVGLFINTLPVRVSIDAHQPLENLLQQLQKHLAMLSELSWCPLTRVQGWSEIPRGLPLFESILIFENYPVDQALRESNHSLELARVDRHEQTNFPLTLVCDLGKTLSMKLSYETGRYTVSGARRMLAGLEHLIRTLVDHPCMHAIDLDPIPPEERALLAATWNATKAESRLERVHQRISRWALEDPNRPAVYLGDRNLSYGCLEEMSNRLAHHLIHLGIEPDTVVAVCVDRTPEAIVAILGILKAGAAYLPLDPDYPKDRLQYMLNDAGAALVICHEEMDSGCVPAGVQFLSIGDLDGALQRQPATPPRLQIDGDHLAYVIYTSGSTGKPKGVMVSHNNLENQLLWRLRSFPFDENGRMLQNIPLSFDPSVWQIFWPLICGAELHLLESGYQKDSAHFARLVNERGITATAMVPSQLAVLLDEEPFRTARSLQHISCGGEALSVALQERFLTETGLNGVLNVVYGPTEATIDAASQAAFDGGLSEVVHIGKPITNVSLHVVDPYLALQPVTVPGELMIAGAGLARGYHGRPGLTAERFIPNPHGGSPGGRLYRSGDKAAWLEDGRLEFLGRIDQQFKLRGFRIEPGEIEAALMTEPGVKSCAVLVREDEGNRNLVGFIHSDRVLDAIALLNHLRSELPPHMVPSRLVIAPDLPLAPNGKLDRQALKTMTLEAPEKSHDRPFTSPTEEMVAAVWCDVLGCNQVKAQDNFFDLGGHSLLATGVISRLKEMFRMELPLRALFDAPTVRGLACVIDQGRGGDQVTPEIKPAEPQGPHALSFAQERMWFLCRMGGPGALYNLPVALGISGDFDPITFQLAAAELVRRHQSLRTVFPRENGSPVQRLIAEDQLRPRLINLPDPEQLEPLLAREAAHVFDLEQGPLMRLLLINREGDGYVLFLNMHHIISDGWSVGVMIHELTTLYKAFRHEKPSPLPEPVLQYTDYSTWQRKVLEPDRLDERLARWKQMLDGAPALLQMPTDRPRPAIQSFRGAELHFGIPIETAAALKKSATAAGASLYMSLSSAYALLLSRYSGQDDICIGTPVANRNQQDVEQMIGLFINTLVLRLELQHQTDTFKTLLQRVRERCLDAFSDQDLPFGKVVEAVAPQRDLSYTPLFQAFFVLQNNSAPGTADAGLQLTPLPIGEHGVSRFDLTLEMEELEDGLHGRIEYAVDLFDRQTINRFAQHYSNLLQQIAAGNESVLAQWSFTNAQERGDLLEMWHHSAAPGIGKTPVSRLFEQVADAHGESIAVRMMPGLEIRYDALNEAANRLARRLRRQGVSASAPVAVVLPRSIDLAIVILAVFKAGGTLLYLAPDLPRNRMDLIIEDSGACVLVTETASEEGFRESHPEVVCVDEHAISYLPSGNLTTEPSLQDGAYLIYTSGTTGKPKGVMVTTGNLAHTLEGARHAFGFGSRDVMPCIAAFSFDISFFEFFGPLLAGGVSLLMTREEILEMDLLEQAVRSATCLHTVPGLMEQLVAHAREEMPEMRRVFIGGDRVPPALLEQMRPLFPQARIDVLYGPTEATIICTHYPLPVTPIRGHIIGSPLPNVVVRVADRFGHLAPIGVPGELLIGGDGVAEGYLKRPELTREKFVEDTYAGSGRLYRSGDMVRLLSDGLLEFLGRVDQQIKIRGFRVEPAEIEVLLTQRADVEEALVLAHEEKGHGSLVAYLRGDDGGDLQSWNLRLRAYLAERVPDYMVPAVFISLSRFPLNSNGKIDRKALPAPDRGLAVSTDSRAASTPAEQQLAEIWAELLGLESVGIDDNFFALGGDSILSIQVVARAATRGMHLTSRQVFQHQTIAELAEVAAGSKRVVAQQEPVVGPLQLLPVQTGFLERGHSNPHHFNQSLFFRITDGIHADDLLRAFDALWAHHDLLRLRVSATDGSFHSETGPVEAAPFEVRDLGLLPLSQQMIRLEEEAAMCQSSLHLERGPIARVILYRMGDELPDHLLIIIHHMAIDAVSWRILLEDLQAVLHAANHGRSSVLPPKTTSFAAWSQRLLDWSQSEEFAGEHNWWLDLAADAAELHGPRSLALQPDDALMAHAVTISDGLDKETTRRLLQEAPAAFNTRINDLLLTALARAMRCFTGEDKLLVDLEGHGREEVFDDVDLSRTIGWFTVTAPALLELAADDKAEDIKNIKEHLRRRPNQGLGFGLVSFPRTLQADVLFNYLGQTDQTLEHDGMLQPAGVGTGPNQDPQSLRSHMLEVNCLVSEGCLRFHLSYARGQLDLQMVEDLTTTLRQELCGLVDYCSLPETGGRTPSDFPYAGLKREQLDALTVSGDLPEDLYPLTPLQQGMLFHALLAGQHDPYLDLTSCVFPQGIDAGAFRAAWNHVIQRHASLRTSFVWQGLERPLQWVHESVEACWREDDWSHLDGAELDHALEQRMEQQRAVGLPPETAPLMSFELIQLAGGACRFMWWHHHLILDGWSLPIIFSEVLTCYHDRQQASSLPRVAPYRNYIAWLEEQNHREAEIFWRQQLAGFDAPVPLPGDRGAGGQGSPRQSETVLDATLTGALQTFARSRRLTVNTLVQAAWALVLHHFSGHNDIIFGGVVAGRPANVPDVTRMVGMFINTLPVRTVINPDTLLSDWLDQLQNAQSGRDAYAYTPLFEMRDWCPLDRDLPLFDSIMVFENYPLNNDSANSSPGIPVGEVKVDTHTHYALTLTVMPGDQLAFRMDYDGNRLETAAVETMASHLQMLLQAFPECGSIPLADLPRVSPAHESLLASWNRTQNVYPRRTLPELFLEQAARTPGAIALEAPDPHGVLTLIAYDELARRAGELAACLQGMGIGPGMPVGIYCERSPAVLAGLLAIMMNGAFYVPMDPGFPPDRLTMMAEDAGITALLVQSEAVRGGEGPKAEGVPRLHLDHDGNPVEEIPCESFQSVALHADLTAYAIYTSGSTGRPKGVCVQHGALVNFLFSMAREPGLDEADRLLAVTTLSFDIAGLELYLPLIKGARVILADRKTTGDGLMLARFLERVRPTVMQATPATWQMLLHAGWTGQADLNIFCGGDRLTPHLAEELAGCGRSLWNLYGPTETTIWSTVQRLDGEDGFTGRVTVGKPIANTTVHVVDARMRPCPLHASGRLLLGGDGLTRGYLGRPALTARVFLPDPFGTTPGQRLYDTGDLARFLDNGQLLLLGRADHQVKLRGFRIEPGEIESRLKAYRLGEAAPIEDAIVLVCNDSTGSPQLVAWLLAPQHEVDEADLRRFLAERLPDYMIPAAIVTLESFPLTPNNKIDRGSLPAPDQPKDIAYVAPRNETEKRLARIWEEVLGVSPIGVHSHFFRLGGHSLTAVRLLAMLKVAFGRELQLALLFDKPTLGQLAEALEQATEPQIGGPLVTLRAEGDLEPIYLVHPAGGNVFCYNHLVQQLSPRRPCFALQSPGLYGGTLHQSIQDMAGHYVEAIRAHRPGGPYLLGGWSQGCVLAYEMAHQLRAAGDLVSGLILLDGYAPEDMAPMESQAELLAYLANALEDPHGRRLNVDPAELSRTPEPEQFDRVLEMARKQTSLAEQLTAQRLRVLWAVAKTNITAALAYEMPPCSQTIHFFAAADVTGTGPLPAWKRTAGKALQVHPTPGNHYSLMEPPHVTELAQNIERCLTEAVMEPGRKPNLIGSGSVHHVGDHPNQKTSK